MEKSTDNSLPPAELGLDLLLQSFQASGGWPPVAVAHSIALDLLADTLPTEEREGAVQASDVTLDLSGRSFVKRPASCVDLINLVTHLIGGGSGKALFPSTARPALGVLEDIANGVLPPEPDRVRLLLAHHLGPPAPYAEVAGVVRSLLGEPELDVENPTLLPHFEGPVVDRVSAVSDEAYALSQKASEEEVLNHKDVDSEGLPDKEEGGASKLISQGLETISSPLQDRTEETTALWPGMNLPTQTEVSPKPDWPDARTDVTEETSFSAMVDEGSEDPSSDATLLDAFVLPAFPPQGSEEAKLQPATLQTTTDRHADDDESSERTLPLERLALPLKTDPPKSDPVWGSLDSQTQGMAEAAGDLLRQAAEEGAVRKKTDERVLAKPPKRVSDRPVVRHERSRSERPVAVSAAPAARRSARAVKKSDRVIVGSSQGPNWMAWVISIGAILAALYLLASS